MGDKVEIGKLFRIALEERRGRGTFPFQNSGLRSGKYFLTCFISSAACGSGANGGLGGFVSPTRKRVLSLGVGRLTEAASR